MEMIWSVLFGAFIMFVGVLVGYAIAATKNPKPTDYPPVLINTSNWPRENKDGFGSGNEG